DRYRAWNRVIANHRGDVAASGVSRAVVDRRRSSCRCRRWDRRRNLSGEPGVEARSDSGIEARDVSISSKIFNITEGIGIAFDAIRSNKVRAALTILGVAVGVFVVVALSAAIHGINASV